MQCCHLVVKMSKVFFHLLHLLFDFLIQKTWITWPRVLQFEVLIRKFPPVNGFPSSSIVVGEVSTLQNAHELPHVPLQQHVGAAGETLTSYLAHELRDHPVESGFLVTETVFSCAQSSEVL